MSQLLRIFKRSIPYIKELRPICKSVTAVILFQQLEYWFDLYPNGFYKFTEPSENSSYKEGDSWSEELGFSAEEFRTAFSKIGVAHASKTDFLKKKSDGMQFLNTDGKEMFYCSVYDRTSHITFYYRNHNVIEDAMDDFLESLKSRKDEPQVPENDNPKFRKTTIPSSGKRQSQVRYTDSTTETTSENTSIVHHDARPTDQNQLPLFDDSEIQYADELIVNEKPLMLSQNPFAYNTDGSHVPAACGKVDKSGKKVLPRGGHAPDAFAAFWAQYPVKKGKVHAQKAWNALKANSELVSTIMHDLSNRKQNDRQWIEGFITHPATYLNGRRWEDEIEPLTKVKSVVQSKQTQQESEEEKRNQARINAVRRLRGEV